MNPTHSIRAVANRTGLTPHVIRVWEKRYAAVEPHRTGTNRRFYTEEDINRLNLLGWLTRRGHGIGGIARLATDELAELARNTPDGESDETAKAKGGRALASALADRHLETAIERVRALDSNGLNASLQAAAIALGNRGLLQKLICPLAQRIGELWREGEITAAHEHFATAAIKMFIGQISGSYVVAGGAPGVIVTTPSGQHHELGAIIASAAAAHLGWNAAYLGPSLPAAELAGAARQNKAKAVALSVVYPTDDPALPDELRRLREALPESVAIIVGGRAAPAYADVLREIGATVVDSPAAFERELEKLREG